MIGISWNEKHHSVGHKVLDKQHKTMLNLINQLSLQQSYFHGAYIGDGEEFIFILDELNKYITEHLAYEEKLLEKIGYEDLSAHKECHQRYIDRIKKVSIDNDDSKYELVKFLTMWWDNHIMSEDMAYKPYVQHLSD